MSKLIRGGIFRTIHSSVFKICLCCTVLLAILFAYGIYHSIRLDDFVLLAEFIVLALLISLAVGNETAGRIRNKLITGHTRTSIFFSELILAYLEMLIFFLIFFLVSLVINLRLLEHTPLSLALKYAFGFFCAGMSIATIIVSVTCLFSKQVVTSITGILLVFALYFSSIAVAGSLSQKEFFVNTLPAENGELIVIEEKNPRYVEEPLRSILINYQKMNPLGQSSEYDSIIKPFLYDNERWEQARRSVPDSNYLNRELSEDDETFLAETPLQLLLPMPIFILLGWLIFRKKEFK